MSKDRRKELRIHSLMGTDVRVCFKHGGQPYTRTVRLVGYGADILTQKEDCLEPTGTLLFVSESGVDINIHTSLVVTLNKKPMSYWWNINVPV